VKYVSTEEFTNDFINSVRDGRQNMFKKRYREADILLVDDIQFLIGKEQVQEEFFHTFNTIHNAQKQIVISSDRPPKQLQPLEDRLRTRFEWGLITDIQPPELETRIAILDKKAKSEGYVVQREVLELIATRVQRNIRELEGALIRVVAFASLNGHEIDVPLAEVVLRDVVSDDDSLQISAATIMAVTAEFFTTSIDRSEGSVVQREVLELIATRVQRNIRELEGALIRVVAFASLNGHEIDVPLAEVVLRDVVSDDDSLQISAATIMAVTAEFFTTSID